MTVVEVCHSLLWSDQFWRTAPNIVASYFNDQVQREVTQVRTIGNGVISGWLRKHSILSLKQEGLAESCLLSPNIQKVIMGKWQ